MSGRLKLAVSKTRVEGEWTAGQIGFVIQHELYHALRGHLNTDIASGKANHEVANIAEDVFINEDIIKDRNFGGTRVKAPLDGICVLTSRVVDGKNLRGVEEMTGGQKYDGPPNSLDLYNFIMKNAKEPPKKPGQPGKPEKMVPKVGDIIRHDKTGQYGRVTSVSGGKVTGIEPIASKEEAEAAVMGGTSVQPVAMKTMDLGRVRPIPEPALVKADGPANSKGVGDVGIA